MIDKYSKQYKECLISLTSHIDSLSKEDKILLGNLVSEDKDVFASICKGMEQAKKDYKKNKNNIISYISMVTELFFKDENIPKSQKKEMLKNIIEYI